MTLSETKDRAALKIHYANKHQASSENSEKHNQLFLQINEKNI